MKWADGGILDELWREKFGYCRCIPLASSTYTAARQARVGGRCRGQSWTGDGLYCGAPNLTLFIQMDGQVAALYLHAN